MSKNGSSSSSEKQQDPIQRALDWANSRLSAFEETATDITTDFTSGQYFVTLIEDITQEELKITYRNPKTIFQKRLTIDACLKYLDNYRFITPIPVKREDILWGETIPTYNLLRMINVRLDNGDLPPLPHDFRPRPPLTSRVQKVEKSQQTNKVTSKKCVGIDIGTSQTKYSIFSRNHVNKFNSVISIRENKKKIGGILKGADHIVLDFKRFIGRDFTDDSLEDETRKMKIYAIEEDSTNFRPIIKLENNKTDSSSNKQISNANNLSKSKKLNDSILHSSKSSSNNVSDRNQNENHNDDDESQKTFTFEQMTAYLFNKIKKSISTESGDDVNDAVLSVPSYFSISQRYALRDAATIAGFNVISVITEPVATGIATRFISSSELKSKNSSNQNPKPGTSSNSKHGKSTISQQKISNSKPTTSNSKPTTSNSKPTTSNTKPNISSGLKTNNKSTNSKQSDSSSKQIKKSNQNNIVIVDVGGGKTEASLLLIDKNNIKPIRNEFNSKLGGSNFDHALAKKYFTYKNSKPETPHEKMQIILAAEHAKIALSTKKQTKIKEMNITKDEFEDCLVLSGGTTKIPKVKEKIEDFFGKGIEIIFSGFDDGNNSSVALGAAIHGAILKGERNEKLKGISSNETLKNSIGILQQKENVASPRNSIRSTKSTNSIGSTGSIRYVKSCDSIGHFSNNKKEILINKGSSLPIKAKTEISTTYDNQTSLSFNVIECEDNSQNIIQLGQVTISDIEPAKKGIPKIDVQVSIDVNGKINVSAKDMTSGKKLPTKYELRINLNENEINEYKEEMANENDICEEEEEEEGDEVGEQLNDELIDTDEENEQETNVKSKEILETNIANKSSTNPRTSNNVLCPEKHLNIKETQLNIPTTNKVERNQDKKEDKESKGKSSDSLDELSNKPPNYVSNNIKTSEPLNSSSISSKSHLKNVSNMQSNDINNLPNKVKNQPLNEASFKLTDDSIDRSEQKANKETEQKLKQLIDERMGSKRENKHVRPVVGIDFGSSKCHYTIFQSSKKNKNGDSSSPNMEENMENIKKFPSLIGLKGDKRIIGNIPKNVKESKDITIIKDMKRLLGHSYQDKEIQNHLKELPYFLKEDPRTHRPFVEYMNEQHSFEEMTGFLFSKIRKDANSNIDNDGNNKFNPKSGSNLIKFETSSSSEEIVIEDAVIAVPSIFTDSQRRSIKNSALAAGFKNVYLINEPTAISLALCKAKKVALNSNPNDVENNYEKTKSENDQEKFMIIDFGAGKIEASIIKSDGKTSEIVDSCGDLSFGGQEFDSRLSSKYFEPINQKEMTQEEIEYEIRRRNEASEEAKIQLSSQDKTTLNEQEITREEFERECQDLIEHCLKPIKQLFQNGQQDKNELQNIILKGGMCQIPRIEQEIRSYFGSSIPIIKPSLSTSDQLISEGASIRGSLLNGNDDPLICDLKIKEKYPQNLILSGATPCDNESNNKENINSLIIPRGHEYPTIKPALTTTDFDNQSKLTIDIIGTTDGNGMIRKNSNLGDNTSIQNSKNSKVTTNSQNSNQSNLSLMSSRTSNNKNIPFGQIKIESIPSYKKGEPKIEVDFEIDDNGLIEPKSREINSGGELPTKFINYNNLSDSEREKIKKHIEETKRNHDDKYTPLVVGIDFGSSKCRYSVFQPYSNNKVKSSKNNNNNNKLNSQAFPSLIGLKGDKRIIGNIPKNVKESKDITIIKDMKRLLGHSYQDKEIQNHLKELPYFLKEDPRTHRPFVEYMNEQHSFEEMTGFLFSKILSDVNPTDSDEENKDKVEEAVISVPALFSISQRQALKDAAHIAGFKQVYFIKEPIATSIALNVNGRKGSHHFGNDELIEVPINQNDENKIKNGTKTNLLIDFGAGKIEASIIKSDGKTSEIVDSCGDLSFGGQEFDSRLSSKYFEPINQKEMTQEEIEYEIRRRNEASEEAKIQLSSQDKTTLNEQEITREEFERECQDLIEHCLKPIKQLFQNGQQDKNELQNIILKGGMCQIPRIEQEIRSYFGSSIPIIKPSLSTSDQLISEGASIRGSLLNGNDDPLIKDINVIDRVSHPIGIRQANGLNSLLFKTDNYIPIKKKTFATTNEDNQSNISFDIIQGNRKMADDCKPIGTIKINDIPPSKRCEPKIEVSMGIDENGMFVIEAKDLSTNNTLPAELISTNNLCEEEKLQIKEKFDQEANGIHTSKKAVGIDIGTCSCRYSIYSKGVKHGTSFPSTVAFKDGVKYVGEIPPNITNDDNSVVISDLKRIIGRDFSDKELVEKIKLLPYNVEKDKINNRPFITIKEEKISLEKLTSMLLTDVKRRLTTETGKEIVDAVITVPAFFPNSQRQAIRDAARIAGFNVIRMVNETAATAMAYNMQQDNNFANCDILNNIQNTLNESSNNSITKSKSKNVVVYDMGGGKVDTSLINLDGGVCTTLNSAGNMNLGGRDLDYRVALHYITDGKKLGDKEMRKCLIDAEKIKISLSDQASTSINRKTITRKEFEETCEDLLEKTVDPVKELFVGAPVTKDKVDCVILTGGSTKIPKIRELIRKFFGNNVDFVELHEGDHVAYGASIQGAIMEGNLSNELDGVEMRDSLLLSIGISQANGINAIIIPHGTVLPASYTIMTTTYIDGQTNVSFDIVQGERKMAADCIKLGHVTVEGIQVAKRCVPKIEVSMKIDEDGFLSVKAKDLTTGASMTTHVYSSSNLNEAEIQTMLEEAETMKEEDKRKIAIAEEKGELAYALDKLERVIREAKLTKTERLEAKKKVSDCREWMNENDDADPSLYNMKRSLMNDLYNMIMSK